MFPRFVIGLVLLLLFLTLTIWFSLDHKRNVSNGVISGIGTLFSPDHNLYSSDYDSNSDSVTSENQPLNHCIIMLKCFCIAFIFQNFVFFNTVIIFLGFGSKNIDLFLL